MFFWKEFLARKWFNSSLGLHIIWNFTVWTTFDWIQILLGLAPSLIQYELCRSAFLAGFLTARSKYRLGLLSRRHVAVIWLGLKYHQPFQESRRSGVQGLSCLDHASSMTQWHHHDSASRHPYRWSRLPCFDPKKQSLEMAKQRMKSHHL